MNQMFNTTPILAKRETFIKNLVLVDGLALTGKRLVASIVSSLECAEQFRMHYLIEMLPMFEDFGLMSREATVSLLVNEMDIFWYDMVVGRNINLRPGDFTSIWCSKNPRLYFERLFSEEKDAALERIKKMGTYIVMLTHDVMAHPRIFFEAFPDIRIIYVKRHPVDLIMDWYERGWGTRFHEDPLCFTIRVKGPTYGVPWYAYGWEEKYERSCPMDRIIHMIERILGMCTHSFENLSPEDRKKTLVVAFEDMAYDPEPVIDRICSFLGTKRSPYTPAVMARERIPREFDKKSRERAAMTIRNLSTDEAWQIVQKMIKHYKTGDSY